jgi:hypothetical protein
MHLYKYMSDTGIRRFINTLKLRFTPPGAFNDPFEFRPKLVGKRLSRQERADYNRGPWIQFFEHTLDRRIGILSLSEDPTNLLMWGHYADCYRGGVIQFETTNEFFTSEILDQNQLQFLTAIRYSKQLAELDLNYINRKKSRLETYNWDVDGPTTLVQERHPLFFTKSLNWAYEREWRLVRRLAEPDEKASELLAEMIFTGIPPVTDQQLIPVPVEAITGIIIGPRSMLSDLWRFVGNALSGDARLAHIHRFLAVLHPGEFKISIVDISEPTQWIGKLSSAEINALNWGLDC